MRSHGYWLAAGQPAGARAPWLLRCWPCSCQWHGVLRWIPGHRATRSISIDTPCATAAAHAHPTDRAPVSDSLSPCPAGAAASSQANSICQDHEAPVGRPCTQHALAQPVPTSPCSSRRNATSRLPPPSTACPARHAPPAPCRPTSSTKASQHDGLACLICHSCLPGCAACPILPQCICVQGPHGEHWGTILPTCCQLGTAPSCTAQGGSNQQQ